MSQNPTLIDVHCHINFNAFKDDADALIKDSLEQGIYMVAPGSQAKTSERAVWYAHKYESVYAAVGLHPIHLFDQMIDEEEVSFVAKAEEFDADFYKQLAQNKKVVAIGECGLDYYRTNDAIPLDVLKKKQEEVFRLHCDLAYELNLPIMIHCRDAHADILRILNDYKSAGKILRGNIHCFTGTWDEAQQYLALDFYVSFTGVVTFPKKKTDLPTETLTDIATKIPLHRILVETDAPYLSPIPFRGKRNQPQYVRHIAEHIALARNLSFNDFAQATVENSRRLFGI